MPGVEKKSIAKLQDRAMRKIQMIDDHSPRVRGLTADARILTKPA